MAVNGQDESLKLNTHRIPVDAQLVMNRIISLIKVSTKHYTFD